MDGTAAIDRLLALAGLGPREPAEATERSRPYVCLGCESTYDVQYHVCPNCGGFSVESRVATERHGDRSETVLDDSTAE
ncbi:hypothetical protein [Halobellus limi]|uniref:Hydrogenase maturation nickel metallochaperone HypA n=1 Tax=Halobellus limi TaxID=699433 RepID=A0A1H5YU10_9EURY|nr:hypothetical protein [Halobellus limi]QCC48354.1 hypothetical protein DV707_12160 [Halobellus limi]SEG26796.1 hypothetical protein SAMN04488133_1700 [Halobellus limi]